MTATQPDPNPTDTHPMDDLEHGLRELLAQRDEARTLSRAGIQQYRRTFLVPLEKLFFNRADGVTQIVLELPDDIDPRHNTGLSFRPTENRMLEVSVDMFQPLPQHEAPTADIDTRPPD